MSGLTTPLLRSGYLLSPPPPSRTKEVITYVLLSRQEAKAMRWPGEVEATEDEPAGPTQVVLLATGQGPAGPPSVAYGSPGLRLYSAFALPRATLFCVRLFWTGVERRERALPLPPIQRAQPLPPWSKRMNRGAEVRAPPPIVLLSRAPARAPGAPSPAPSPTSF